MVEMASDGNSLWEVGAVPRLGQVMAETQRQVSASLVNPLIPVGPEATRAPLETKFKTESGASRTGPITVDPKASAAVRRQNGAVACMHVLQQNSNNGAALGGK